MFRPVFSPPPQSWRDWWRAVREFTAGWYGIPAGPVTGRHPTADALGRELGVALSPSLHEWAAFTDGLKAAGVCGPALRDSPLLCWDEETESVLLMQDVEGTVMWAVRPEHLAEDDPPVREWWDGEPDEPGAGPWHDWTPSVSQFALQHLFAYLRPAGGSQLHISDVPWSAELVDRLRTAGRDSVELDGHLLIEDDDLVMLVGRPLWSDPGQSGVDIQATLGPSRSPDSLVAVTGRSCFRIGTGR